VLYTGVGKVNAAMALTRALAGYRHAGSVVPFETGGRELTSGVVDMEAYALAKVCLIEGTPFACAKFVSDGADHAAASGWQANLHRAAEQFLALYRQLPASWDSVAGGLPSKHRAGP
jgi:nucleoside phosphorylase